MISKARMPSIRFQFTLPRGERLNTEAVHFDRLGFNSRSREGSDSSSCPSSVLRVFQFTLPRGERHLATTKDDPKMTVSIHAPARGATLLNLFGDGVAKFQFMLPRGERHYIS